MAKHRQLSSRRGGRHRDCGSNPLPWKLPALAAGHPALTVGRVGGLAVALGVGGALAAVPGAAAADTGTADATGARPAPAASSVPVRAVAKAAPTRTWLGPSVNYNPAKNVQTGKTITGTLNLPPDSGYSVSTSKPKWTPLASTGRRASSGVTSSQRGPQVNVRPAQGSVTLAADGTFSYVPSPELGRLGGTDSFTITVTDGLGLTAVVPVIVEFKPNAAPKATASLGPADAATGAVAGSLKGSDPDGDSLTYGGSTVTAKGTVSVDPLTGAIAYAPSYAARHRAAADAATAADRSDAFTATITDGWGGTITLPVTLQILPFNIAPTLNPTVGQPDAATGVVVATAGGSDADADILAYSGSATTAKGAFVVDSSTGAITYTPTDAARLAAAAPGAPAADTSDSVTVSVNDGHGGTATAVVTVVVAPANRAPTGVASVGAPNPSNGVVTGAVAGTDADGDTIAYSGSASSAKGNFVLNANGTFTYTPNPTARHAAAANGAGPAATTDTFIVTLSDGKGGVTPVTVTVAVGPANNAPVGGAVTANSFPNGDFANNLTNWTAINSRVRLGGADSVAGWPTPADPTTAPDGGLEAASITGSTSYSSSVTNGRAVMTSSLGGVQNNPAGKGAVVHGPVLVSDNAVFIRGGAIVQFDWEASGGADAFDVLGYLLNTGTGATSIFLDATGANASQVQPITTVNFTVPTDGNYKFVFVSGTWDATKGTAAGARLSIDNVKVLNNVQLNNGTASGTIAGTDADGDTLTYTVTTQPSNGTLTFNPANGAFTYQSSNPGSPAADSFVVTITDDYGGSTAVTVAI